MKRLIISNNGRFIETEDKVPFFWMGDTAWNLIHKLDREEIERYMTIRAAQRFNVIQTALLSEDDGIREANRYGRRPLLRNSTGEYDITQPDTEAGENNYNYWEHVDYTLEQAEKYGFYVALLPFWGDKFNITLGKGPQILTEENAGSYGKWLGKRYGDRENVIWVLGGDRSLDCKEHYHIIDKIGNSLKEESEGKQLVTFHPIGPGSSADNVHREKWLDFNMVQSGHAKLHKENYKMIESAYNKNPIKPVLDAESRYEGHPVNFCPDKGYFDAWDVRQAAYWSVFSGAFGHTYGHHCVWSMNKTKTAYFPMTWQEALNDTAGNQMIYLRNLMISCSFGEGKACPEIVKDNKEGANYSPVFCTPQCIMVYSPAGIPFNVVKIAQYPNKILYSWYSPVDGSYTSWSDGDNTADIHFMPPRQGRGHDWVLVIRKESI